jgi:hypothetical protein
MLDPKGYQRMHDVKRHLMAQNLAEHYRQPLAAVCQRSEAGMLVRGRRSVTSLLLA